MSPKTWLWILLGLVGLYFLTMIGSYNGLVSANVGRFPMGPGGDGSSTPL